MSWMKTVMKTDVLFDVTGLALVAWLSASCVTATTEGDTGPDEDVVEEGASGNAEEVVQGQYGSSEQDAAPVASNATSSAGEEVPDSVLESAGESNALSQADSREEIAGSGADVSPEDEQALAALVGNEQQPAEVQAQPDAAAQVEVVESTPEAEPVTEESTAVAEAAAITGESTAVAEAPGPVQTAPVVSNSVSTNPLPARPATSTLSWLGYNYRAGEGLLHVEMKTKGNPQYNVFQEINRAGQPELVVRLFSTKVRRPIRRPVDASEFRSPVSFIRTRSNPAAGSVDVILTLREAVQPKMMAKEGGLTLTYRIPDHWYGIRRKGNVASAAPAEVAEPLAKANLFPVFDPASRKPEIIDANDSNHAVLSAPEKGEVSAPAAPAIPPQGSIILRPAGSAWMVGQDDMGGINSLGLNDVSAPVNTAPARNTPVNAASTAPVNGTSNPAVSKRTPELSTQAEALQNQANIAAIASAAGKELTGQDETGRPAGRNVRKINLDFRGAPLSEVIKAITDKSGVNFVYSGAVAATPVTVQLIDIPWDIAFKSILDLNSLGLVRIADNLYRVDLLANIAREKEQIEAARIASQRLEPTRIMFLRLSYAQASEAVALVNEMLANARSKDPRIQIRAEQRTNSLIVEAPARELARVKALVERIDLQTPQVKIESRVVEVVKNMNKTFGISWGAPFFFDQSRGLGFGSLPFPNFMRSDFAVQAGGTGSGIGSMNFVFGSINNSFNLDLHLRMTESEKLSETLQTNSVIVQNNQSANITGGQSDIFVLGSSAPGTAPQVLSVDYNLTVAVTPTVTADGAVRMTMNISSSSPTASSSAAPNALGRVTRSINTVLLRRSGETAVIGGLNTRERSTGWEGIPVLSRIPIIGALFRSSDKKQSNRELLVMVTPTIMNVAQSTGDNGNATFDEDAGTASSASPDKLDTSGATSEFRAEDIEDPATGAGEMANLAPANAANNSAGNNGTNSGSGNQASGDALNEAIDEIDESGSTKSGETPANNSANNAL